MSQDGFIPYRPERLDSEVMLQRARAFYERMDIRRSVRFFSDDSVPKELIELAILSASTAPSGAHRQPWKFIAISDPETKRVIREAVEEEERISYEQRMSEEWLEALEPMGTNWQKPYLEKVPWIVVAFEELHRVAEDGSKIKNYYVKESVGIACGLFVAALHDMGLATLTHTPSPMGFLGDLLGRPKNERAMIMFPIGYPADDATVPNLKRKSLEEISAWDPQRA